MRKLILAITLITVACHTNAQDSLTHQSAIVYELKGFSIIMVCQAIADPLLSQTGNHIQAPPKERVVNLYGDLLHIYLTTNKEPFPEPVTKVPLDADRNGNQRIFLQDLEIRRGILEYNEYTNWMGIQSFPLLNKDSPISLFPLTPGKLAVTQGDYYILMGLVVMPYNTRVVSIRNKNTKEEIFNFRFKVIGKPVLPFLTLATQNDSDKKLTDSFIKTSTRMIAIPDINEVLNPDGSKVSREVLDNPMVLKNEDLYETSELVLYFKKQNGYYPDSSMEFRLVSETNKDTAWLQTGHRLVVSHLVPGNHYKLQVRYELHPDYIQEHTFYVVPKWYQATQTKIIFACLLVLVALLTWLLIYYRLLNKSRRRREQLSLEIRSIRSQLNPHFIFNALSSIQGLINKNDIPAANHYLTEFSTLLRESLHNNEKEMVPLVTEVNLLETYLKLEQLRFKFKYEINIDEAINKNATEIPNLLLQPLVENAVKHGVSSLAERGFIKTDFVKRGQDLHVSITDNGNKFEEAPATDGFGLKLTKSRISLLGQTLKEQPIKLTIERRQDIETIVHLVFTNWV